MFDEVITVLSDLGLTILASELQEVKFRYGDLEDGARQ